MILGFKTQINGKLTKFRDKILKHLGDSAIDPFLARIANPGFMQLVHLSIIDSTPKKLTIRDDPNNRWQAGQRIHFATGARTKQYNCFAIGECKDTKSIVFDIGISSPLQIFINDKRLNGQELAQLAQDDGFEDVKTFLGFHWPLDKRPRCGTLTKKVIYF